MKIESNWPWLAGVFDGEGHISTRDRSGNGHLPRYRSPRSIVLTVNQHHPEMLNRLFEVVEYRGNLYEFTKKRPANTITYSPGDSYTTYGWRTGKRSDILYIVGKMWPWLGLLKRAQCAMAIDLHTSLDPKREQVNPLYVKEFLLNYTGDLEFQKLYKKRTGESDKEDN